MQRERATHRQSFLTRLGGRRSPSGDETLGDSPPEAARAGDQPREPLERMLAPLSPLQRNVLVRRITKGHSAKRVAMDLGVSLAEVRTIQRGALRRILPSAY